MAITYRHRRNDTNEIFYIGIGKKDNRAYIKSNRSDWWKRVVNKVGYTVDIIANNISWEDACELEMFLISEYGRVDNKTGQLINQTNGGDGNDYWLGKKRSKKTIDKIRGTQEGKVTSQETKDKISKSNKGNTKSKEHINNMSKGKIGKYGISIIQLTKNNEFIKEWKCIRDAARYLGDVNKNAHILKVCKGERKTAYNFKWEYKNI